MAKRPTLTDLTSLTNSSAINTLNQNWDAIQEAFDNTLSLDGSTPNAMGADLDLNGNALLNVGTIDVENLTLDGQTVTDLASVPEWRSSWVTSTAYIKNDLVKINGNVYICLESHTSGTFSTDLTALKWEVLVTKGDSGVGSGDLVSTNNLSDLANIATARSNLGLGTAAVESVVPVSKGGTGATDAASARTVLGAQASDDTLTSLSSLSLVQGDILYATAADTLERLPKGTAGQILRVNSGATAPEWGTVSSPVLLATKTASASSSIDFTEFNNSIYSRYEFDLENIIPTTDGSGLWVRVSTDALNYDQGAAHYAWAYTGTGSGSSAADSFIAIGPAQGNAFGERGVTGTLRLWDSNSVTSRARITGLFTGFSTASALQVFSVGGVRLTAQDTVALRFLMSSGTISSGTIKMYGIV